MAGARTWVAADRTGGPLDEVFDQLRSKFEELVIERLVKTHPADDDNVYWLTIGPPQRGPHHPWEEVQVDTAEGGCLPFLLEGKRDLGERITANDPQQALAHLDLWLQRRAATG